MYNWYGDIISEIDANGETYQYAYDKLARLTKVTNPDSSTQEYSYDVGYAVNDVTAKDENGNIIKTSYDNYGRVIAERDVTNNVLLSEHSREHIDYEFIWQDVVYSTQTGKTTTRTHYNGLGQQTEKEVLDANGT